MIRKNIRAQKDITNCIEIKIKSNMKNIRDCVDELRRLVPVIKARYPSEIFFLRNAVMILDHCIEGTDMDNNHMLEPANRLLSKYLEKISFAEKQMELF